MDNQKKSFLLYHDNYPMLLYLSPEQRGWLLTALYVYAGELSRGEDVSMEDVTKRFPKMTEETRMAFGFMGSNISRDTKKWFAQQQYRSQRKAQTVDKTAPAAQGDLSREREDMERIRRIMEEERLRDEEDGKNLS